MARLWAVLAVVVSFLLVAPVIESGTPGHVHVFQAVGDACDSGGGGGWSPFRPSGCVSPGRDPARAAGGRRRVSSSG